MDLPAVALPLNRERYLSEEVTTSFVKVLGVTGPGADPRFRGGRRPNSAICVCHFLNFSGM